MSGIIGGRRDGRGRKPVRVSVGYTVRVRTTAEARLSAMYQSVEFFHVVWSRDRQSLLTHGSGFWLGGCPYGQIPGRGSRPPLIIHLPDLIVSTERGEAAAADLLCVSQHAIVYAPTPSMVGGGFASACVCERHPFISNARVLCV